jgi:hypothetical protein
MLLALGAEPHVLLVKYFLLFLLPEAVKKIDGTLIHASIQNTGHRDCTRKKIKELTLQVIVPNHFNLNFLANQFWIIQEVSSVLF